MSGTLNQTIEIVDRVECLDGYLTIAKVTRNECTKYFSMLEEYDGTCTCVDINSSNSCGGSRKSGATYYSSKSLLTILMQQPMGCVSYHNIPLTSKIIKEIEKKIYKDYHEPEIDKSKSRLWQHGANC